MSFAVRSSGCAVPVSTMPWHDVVYVAGSIHLMPCISFCAFPAFCPLTTHSIFPFTTKQVLEGARGEPPRVPQQQHGAARSGTHKQPGVAVGGLRRHTAGLCVVCSCVFCLTACVSRTPCLCLGVCLCQAGSNVALLLLTDASLTHFFHSHTCDPPPGVEHPQEETSQHHTRCTRPNSISSSYHHSQRHLHHRAAAAGAGPAAAGIWQLGNCQC